MLFILFGVATGMALGDLLGQEFRHPADNLGRLGLGALMMWFSSPGVVLFMKDFKIYRPINHLAIYTLLVLVSMAVVGTWAAHQSTESAAATKPIVTA